MYGSGYLPLNSRFLKKQGMYRAPIEQFTTIVLLGVLI